MESMVYRAQNVTSKSALGPKKSGRMTRRINSSHQSWVQEFLELGGSVLRRYGHRASVLTVLTTLGVILLLQVGNAASIGAEALQGHESERVPMPSSLELPMVLSRAPELGRIRALAESFHLDQVLSARNSVQENGGPCLPPPSPTACVDAVCKRLGHFGCDDASEVRQAARACVGNYGSECFEYVCTQAGMFACDEMSEVSQAANACRGNVDASCVQSVCAKLGAFGCDRLDRVVPVARSCGGSY